MQIASTSTVYPQPFKSNLVVGVLWSTKADYSTWFGSNVSRDVRLEGTKSWIQGGAS